MKEILEFKNEYKDFVEFYDDTKEQIYYKIFDLYKKIVDDETIMLIVRATVDDLVFDTNFEINKSKSKILEDLIKPYFEKNEEFELCQEIQETYEKLNKNNY